MPLAAIPGALAYQTLRTHRDIVSWPARVEGQADRVQPVARPEFQPTFHIKKGEPVFTVGSCFARAIETFLGRHGYPVPMAEYKPKEAESLGFLNKFTPHSMLNEFQWALDPAFADFDQRKALIDVGDDLYVDGQVTTSLELPLDRCMARRREVNDLFRALRQCRIVVITLGLVEAWYDKQTGLYLNNTIPRKYRVDGRDMGRFELHVLSFPELYDCTKRIVDLILEHGHPETRILMTVSPVALTATFTQQDVLVANMYSKSALRTVAEHIWRGYEQVDYLPSYESVMLSDRKRAMQDDHIHVQAEMVSENVSRMVERYADAGGAGLSIEEAKVVVAAMVDA